MDPIPLFENNRQSNSVDDNLCSICLEVMNININNIYTIPECNHIFHTNCIIEWFRSSHDTCPLCRSNRIINPSYYCHKNLFKIILDYSKRKNAPKKLVKIVDKYRKNKIKFDNSNKEFREFKKKNKELFRSFNIVKNKKFKFERNVRILKREILSIPIQYIKIIKK